MSDLLSISVFQIPLAWNNPKANRSYIESYLDKLSNVDIVVFPETFTTGFAVATFQPEKMEGETVMWMQELSQKFQIE